MYLLFAQENGVVGEDDAEGDDAGGGGIKLSMSGEEELGAADDEYAGT